MNKRYQRFFYGVFVFGLTIFAPLKYVYADNYAIITGNNVNVRSGAGLNSKIIASLNKNDRVIYLGYSNGWYRIRLTNGKEGWIYGKYAKMQNPVGSVSRGVIERKAFIKASNVNMRSGSSIKSKVIATLEKGQPVTVKGQRDGWFNVVLSDGRAGWVYGTYVSMSIEAASRGSVERVNGVNGQKIVEYAKNFLGTRYVYGGSSPSGFDCSGFTSYVYRHFGISLPRTADEQGSHGIYVSRNDLIPGDLVFFATNGSRGINHAGIYIGDNHFIHSSSARKGVIISELSGYYNETYVTARRYLKD